MSEISSQTRRKYPRLAPKAPIQVYRGDELIGVVVNLSQEGMMLMTSTSLEDNAIHPLQLHTMLPGERELSVIACGVDCLWSTPGEGEDEAAVSFWAGCHIIDISDDNFEKLLRILVEAGSN